MNKNKRGQVTLFIIIAIVIVAAGLAAYFIYQNYQRTQLEKTPEISSLNYYIKDSLDEKIINSFILAGLQGGYSYMPPDKSLSTNFEKIPYYYYDEELLIPSLEMIEEQISKKIEQKIEEINFSTFTDIIISKGNPDVDVKIDEDKIFLIIVWPITVTLHDHTIRLDDEYNFQYSLRIKKLIEIAENLTESNIEDPGYIDLELVSYFQENNNIIITPFIIEKDILYKLDDQEFKLKNQPYYTFQFAIKNE